MKVLSFMWRWWRRLWQPSGGGATGIDSHKWESKIEIIRRLSSNHR